MRWADCGLIGKKIFVGAIVTLVPLGVLLGALLFTEKVLPPVPRQSAFASQANAQPSPARVPERGTAR